MGRITLEQAALWCGGKIDPKYKDVTFLGANNDTRKLQKDQLFRTVIFDGALPRKTFSMGHAVDKRYYLECRKIK